MKRGRLPLTALRSFESAGRLSSFTAAAAELHVSQAAISRQVRDLEILIGRSLFERRHRGVVLTERGRDLLAVLTGAFDAIDSSLEHVTGAAGPDRVTISCEPSFASLWLIPHLDRFRHLHPGIEVEIDSDPRPVEFRASSVEVAIRFSDERSDWPRTEACVLTPTEMIPVAATRLAEYIRDFPRLMPAGLPGLLHLDNRDMWGRWFDMAGLSAPGGDRGPVFDDAALVLQAVLRGHGIGLVDRLFAAEEIAAGRIRPLSDLAVPCGAYFVVCREFARLAPGARLFVAWIRGEFP